MWKTIDEETNALKVPGGMLVRTWSFDFDNEITTSEALCFVPDVDENGDLLEKWISEGQVYFDQKGD